MTIRRPRRSAHKPLWCGSVTLHQAFVWLKPEISYRLDTVWGVKVCFFIISITVERLFPSRYQWWLRTMRWRASRSSSALQAPCPSSRWHQRQVPAVWSFAPDSTCTLISHDLSRSSHSNLGDQEIWDTQIQAVNFAEQFPPHTDKMIAGWVRGEILLVFFTCNVAGLCSTCVTPPVYVILMTTLHNCSCIHHGCVTRCNFTRKFWCHCPPCFSLPLQTRFLHARTHARTVLFPSLQRTLLWRTLILCTLTLKQTTTTV